MRIEVPMFGRCCFCIPLRYGLLVWGYIKLIAAVYYTALLAYIGMTMVLDDRVVVIIWVGVVLCLIDLCFSIVFVIGAHKKDYKLLRVYYRYSLNVLIINIALISFVVGVQIYKASTYSDTPRIMHKYIQQIIEQSVMFFLNIALQVYLLFLIRSEVLKLKSNCHFQFVNIAADSHCQMKNTNADIDVV